MLNNRFVKYVIGVNSVRKLATCGTPQGGVQSPLLWLHVVNDILRTFEAEGHKVVAYADDVVIMAAGKSLSTISGLVQTALNKLAIWTKGCGLGVNPLKTELVLFTHRYKTGEFRKPRLDGIVIHLSSEAKYLGVILDQKNTMDFPSAIESCTFENFKKAKINQIPGAVFKKTQF